MATEKKSRDKSLRNEPRAASAYAGAFLPGLGTKEQLPSFRSIPKRRDSNSSRMNTYVRCSRNPFRMRTYKKPLLQPVWNVQIQDPPGWVGVSKIKTSRPVLGIAHTREKILSTASRKTCPLFVRRQHGY
jgi:hypothetical protein